MSDPTPEMTPEEALAYVTCLRDSAMFPAGRELDTQAHGEWIDHLWRCVANVDHKALPVLRAVVERDARAAAECLKMGIHRDHAIIFAETKDTAAENAALKAKLAEQERRAGEMNALWIKGVDELKAKLAEAEVTFTGPSHKTAWMADFEGAMSGLMSENAALKAKLADSEDAFLERSNAYEDLNSELNRALERGTHLEVKLAEAEESRGKWEGMADRTLTRELEWIEDHTVLRAQAVALADAAEKCCAIVDDFSAGTISTTMMQDAGASMDNLRAALSAYRGEK